MMENQNNDASDELYGERDLGRGSPEPELQSPAVGGGPSGATLRMATTRHNGGNTSANAADSENVPPALEQGAIDEERHAVPTAPRMRKKWTNEINTFLMRIYYRITNLETDMLRYRDELHQEFSTTYPEMNASAQRLSDQIRAIKRRNLLPSATLNSIKDEVRREVEDHITHQKEDHTEEMTPIDDSPKQLIVDRTNIPNRQIDTSALNESLKTEFHTALIQYKDVEPKYRPKIPTLHTSVKLSQIVELLNTEILPSALLDAKNIAQVHAVVYCSAVATARAMGFKVTSDSRVVNKQGEPAWKKRLSQLIDTLRTDIGRLTSFQKKSHNTPKLLKQVQNIREKYGRHGEVPNLNDQQIMDTMKQKLSVYSARLARYNKSYKRKTQNHLFNVSEKAFYRSLDKKKHECNEDLKITPQELENFWAPIYTNKDEHNQQATWLSEISSTIANPMEYSRITETDVKAAISRTANWKAAGPDKIQNFWWKRLWVTHAYLAEHFSKIVSDPELLPSFFTTAITHLIPKDTTKINDPSKYRPIACLPTIYKILTACISNKIYNHLDRNSLIAEEQKGCIRKAYGCKEQLVIDSVISNQAIKSNRNIHMAYIDYQKAFDSVPHSWLKYVLKLYGIHPQIRTFLGLCMKKWNTDLTLHHQGKSLIVPRMRIKKGIFQGDSLSALWFVMSINPLSLLLNNSRYGFELKTPNRSHRLSHLLYMDDLKLYASSKQQLSSMIRIVEMFSTDIRMKFGLDKCRTIHINKGKFSNVVNIQESEIQNMQETDLYKYLGIEQARNIDHVGTREKLEKIVYERTRKIANSCINGRNMSKALNTFVIPVLTYSFGIIKWSKTSIKLIESKMRSIYRKHGHLHPNSCRERWTLPRSEGGRGVIHLLNMHNKQVNKLREYFYNKDAALHKTVIEADKKYTPLNMADRNAVFQIEINDEILHQWAQKAVHGGHFSDLHQEDVDIKASNKWLSIGDLYAETEGYLLAIQDRCDVMGGEEKNRDGDRRLPCPRKRKIFTTRDRSEGNKHERCESRAAAAFLSSTMHQ
ncbi:uncharacterized protein LOC132700100 [Cylas formicarius]|uniref:uncharacterized protein LOC132700100 n=1 Tax=Cylas formicarius TaxID=197179 RepID=UPI002958D002|nr:uncharacterized protein LOC132700100 [Cylas formicarius]